MRELGLAMLLVGLVSLALPFINPNVHYIFLTWIDTWGPGVAWGIRGGITLVGLFLWLRYRGRD
ncbi:hypothetical protein [Hymenobacter cheonanensis]|uniref:hypothetical protein n=1 Tax=Hymenobacter sp. CA2-7 TaxID=3063993 RepID=UPI002712ED75|nr:hypothetical protein [Hymenobacter sp. CA2-7]MDO7884830.1 hypothetical protein [Hymenobacter sp. CA2-7]